MKIALAVLLVCATLTFAQSPKAPADPLQALAFLQGTWEAKAQGNAGAAANGTYTFRFELGNHVLARHSLSTNCSGPTDFDCWHRDLLYVYSESAGSPPKAIYFDNEGHVIHYDVTVQGPGIAIFLSDASVPGPQFRLMYTRKDETMSGKFQMRMPGKSEWQSYLEWSGSKK